MNKACPLFLLVLLVCSCTTTPPRPRPADRTVGPAATQPIVALWQMRPLPADEANLMVFGDLGNNKHQSDVARTMAAYVQWTGIQFNAAIVTGDNMFRRMRGADDQRWATYFEEMYDARRLNMPFYMVPGNHDYDNDLIRFETEYAWGSPDSRWKMPSRWYRVDLPEGKPLVSIFVIDSNWERMPADRWYAQFRWLQAELGKPRTAPFTLVTAHHPLYSNGAHGDGLTMQRFFAPLLREHKVDFYVCGHDHDLQHLQLADGPTSFLVAGGGGATTRPIERDNRGPFARSLFGFAHMRFTSDKVEVIFISSGGDVVHRFVRTAQGEVRVLATTGTDSPTTKPARRRKAFFPWE